jgi:4a-hydroxytetrahydrobiopterin dehydratase
MNLAQQSCVPCSKGDSGLTPSEALTLLKDLSGWNLGHDEKWIEREFKFKNFQQALSFLNEAGEICEQLGHHADFGIGWGYVKATIQTHSIGGLHINDFILAARINELINC